MRFTDGKRILDIHVTDWNDAGRDFDTDARAVERRLSETKTA